MEPTEHSASTASAESMLRINEECRIPRSALVFRTSRSGGPGGQHVNKVETKVEVLYDLQTRTDLSAEQRERVRQKLRSRIDADGVLHVVASTSRSQWQNREQAVRKFVELMSAALKQARVRRKTRPSARSVERRLTRKKRRGETKRLRKPP